MAQDQTSDQKFDMTLEQAALAAIDLIADLEEERTQIQYRIEVLQTVVKAWEAVSEGNAPTKPDERLWRTRGLLGEHVDIVLEDGVTMRVRDIIATIADRFAVTYPRSSVEGTLRRGLGIKYEKRGRLWLKVQSQANGEDRSGVLHDQRPNT